MTAPRLARLGPQRHARRRAAITQRPKLEVSAPATASRSAKAQLLVLALAAALAMLAGALAVVQVAA